MIPDSHWASRALQHAHSIANRIGPRGANSPEEKLAADYVGAQLQAIGIADARLEACRAARSGWQPVAMLFSIAVWGSIICWAGFYLTRIVAIGALIGAALCLLALWSLYRHFTLKRHPLQRWLARATTHNVIGRVAPTAGINQRVVLVANLDSPPEPWIFHTPGRRRFFQIVLTISVISLGVGIVMFLLGAFKVWGWAFVVAGACGFAQSAGVLLAIQADQGEFTANANENASGLGLLLALGENLQQAPLTRTEVWLLACGSHTTDSGGLRTFLDRYRSDLGDAWFVGLERVGIGQRVVHTDGRRAAHARSSAVKQLIEQAGMTSGSPSTLGKPTPIEAAQARGYRTICLSMSGDAPAQSAASLQLGAFQLAYRATQTILHSLDQ